MSWPQVMLEDLVVQKKGSLVSGPFGSNISAKFFVDDGVPVIRGNNLTKGEQKFVDEGFAYLTPSKAAEFSNCIAIEGDIIFTAAGSIGQVGIIPEESKYPQYIISNKQLRARIDREMAVPLFIYYWLSSRKMVKWLEGMNNGGAVPLLNLGIVRKAPIPCPPKKTQIRICEVLSAYDDLIANNRRRIQLLEQAARLLYKEWFVHLRFPGHEHVKIKDGVPEGWERKLFPDVVDFKEGPGLRNYQYRDKGIPFLNIRTFNDDEIDLSKTKCIDEAEVVSKYQHFLLDEDDHVVSSSGTLGRVVTVRKCHLPVMLNTSLIRMRPKGIMKKWFLKAYLKYGDYVDQATSMATGAAQMNYGPSHLKAMSILLPNAQLIELFEEHVGAMYKQIKLLLDSNLQLAKARDLLLPRLMSGEFSV